MRFPISDTGENKTPKIAFSLFEVSDATGLSVNFLRYEVRRGNLQTRKFGRRVLVLAKDLHTYIEQGSQGGKQLAEAV